MDMDECSGRESDNCMQTGSQGRQHTRNPWCRLGCFGSGPPGELASFNLAAAAKDASEAKVASHFTIGLCMLMGNDYPVPQFMTPYRHDHDSGNWVRLARPRPSFPHYPHMVYKNSIGNRIKIPQYEYLTHFSP
jgi:hypothetical protein